MDMMVTFAPQSPYPKWKCPWYLLYSSLFECFVERKYLLPLIGIKAWFLGCPIHSVQHRLCTNWAVPASAVVLVFLIVCKLRKCDFVLICTVNLVQCKLLPLRLMWVPCWLNMRGMRSAVGSGTQDIALRQVHNTAEKINCTCASSTRTEPTAKIFCHLL
jgi:hypothetical protein